MHHHADSVGDYEIFYRQAGPAGSLTVVLLYGCPTSSFIFRELILLLANDTR